MVPYVWNGRLLVLWLQLHQQSPSPANIGTSLPRTPPSNKPLGDKLSEVSHSVAGAATNLTTAKVGAVLCYSEYCNGDWQPVKTSAVTRPLAIASCAAGTFDRSTLYLRPWTAADPDDESLYVQVTTDPFPVVEASIVGPGSTVSFEPRWQYGTTIGGTGLVLPQHHSPPVSWQQLRPRTWSCPETMVLQSSGQPPAGIDRNLRHLHRPVGRWAQPTSPDGTDGQVTQDIVNAQSDVADQSTMPFFFRDSRSVFYVTTSHHWQSPPPSPDLA